MSLDGFIAGPNQSVDHPLGMGGERLHEWVVPLKVWREMHELKGGVDNESTAVFEESLRNIGASIMGRNMFGGHPSPWDPQKPWRRRLNRRAGQPVIRMSRSTAEQKLPNNTSLPGLSMRGRSTLCRRFSERGAAL